MSGFNWRQFELGVLRPTLAKLEPVVSSPEVAVRLVGETIWHESDHLQALGQYANATTFGPGLGICSMELPTWHWLLKEYISRRPKLGLKFSSFCTAPTPPYEEFAWNLALNVAGCRLRYFVDQRPLPHTRGTIETSIETRSRCWLSVYNGSGVEERRLKYVADAKLIPWGTP